MTDIDALANAFPSQGGVEIGPWLERYAAEVPRGSAIVELGCWLGAGTAFLSLGARKSGAEIHVWDRFFCPGDEEKDKAAKFGVKLEIGEDTLPRVRKSLEPFGVNTYFHKGSFKPGVASASWTDIPIGLYVDDLTKVAQYWDHAMSIFQPYFIPDKTVLVLQDYYFFESMRDEGYRWEQYLCQKNYMEKHAEHFEMIDERMGGTSAAAFRFIG